MMPFRKSLPAGVLTFYGSGPKVTVTRERCQKCAHCDHTVSVTLTTDDDAMPAVIYEPYAEVFWRVAKDQGARNAIGGDV